MQYVLNHIDNLWIHWTHWNHWILRNLWTVELLNHWTMESIDLQITYRTHSTIESIDPKNHPLKAHRPIELRKAYSDLWITVTLHPREPKMIHRYIESNRKTSGRASGWARLKRWVDVLEQHTQDGYVEHITGFTRTTTLLAPLSNIRSEKQYIHRQSMWTDTLHRSCGAAK